jgi:hyperosmotically inducible protein
MKTLLLLLIGAVIGIVGYRYYQRSQHPTMEQRADAAVSATKDKAGEFKEVVVDQSKKVGGTMDDAWITSTIKGKYLLDKELSVFAISVSCTKGHVSLSGKVASAALATRAARLAHETSGVVGVNSELVVGE